MGKKNWITILGISSALLVGSGSVYAAQVQKDESVKDAPSVLKESNETTTQETQESGKLLTQLTFTDEAFFTRDGQPYYFANSFLNNKELFTLLNLNGDQLIQELATGKSVNEIASSKNVSTQQVIDAIAKVQVEVQIQAEEDGEIPENNMSMEQRLKEIEPKVLQVIEHKSN